MSLLRRTPSQRASALVLAMVLLGIGSIILLGSSNLLNNIQRVLGFRGKRGVVRTLAEQGLDLAYADLVKRARQRDWTQVTDPEGPYTLSQLISMGLVVDLDIERPTVLPRFSKIDAKGTGYKVFYFPSDDNADAQGGTTNYDSNYPKYFHVVSESRDATTGVIQSVEAMVVVGMQSTADYALGFFENPLTPGPYTSDDTALQSPPYVMIPTLIRGPTHLGKIHKNNFYFGASYYHPDAPQPPSNAYYFEEVSFHQALGSVGANTFARDDVVSLTMSAIRDDYPLGLDFMSSSDVDQWITALKSGPAQSLGSGDVCLVLQGNQVQAHACFPDRPDPTQRFGAPSGSPLTIGQQGLFLWCDCQLHIKGTLSGTLGVISTKNIWLEGDIVYADQSPSSKDFFSAYSRGSFMIPSAVPIWEHRYFDDVSGYPSTPTNFLATNDRDTGDDAYYNANGTPGSENAVATLDLDGAYFSTESLYLSPAIGSGGDLIQGVSGQLYNQNNPLVSNYYYVWDESKGRWLPKEPPLICAEPGTPSSDCPVGQELTRQYAGDIWIYGSLTLETPPRLHHNGQGFQRLVINWDERLGKTQTYGAPQLTEPKVQMLWMKHSQGPSEFLKGQNADG